jgi:3-phenylpropionate/cinnamic acid dioxygenase small subunit
MSTVVGLDRAEGPIGGPLGTRTGRITDLETHWSVTQFLEYEADLLDEWRYREWYELISDDFTYRIPIPITTDDPTLAQYSDTAFVVDETKGSLEYWVRRYDPDTFESAWGENPRHRTRRFLTNIKVFPGAASDELAVSCRELLVHSRQSDPAVLTTARRDDVLRRSNGSWLVVQREVFLDQNVHTMPHLRVIF